MFWYKPCIFNLAFTSFVTWVILWLWSFQKLPRLATRAFSTTTKQMKNKVPDHQNLFQVSKTSLGRLGEKQSQTRKTRGVLSVNLDIYWQSNGQQCQSEVIWTCLIEYFTATLTWFWTTMCRVAKLMNCLRSTVVGQHPESYHSIEHRKRALRVLKGLEGIVVLFWNAI